MASILLNTFCVCRGTMQRHQCSVIRVYCFFLNTTVIPVFPNALRVATPCEMENECRESSVGAIDIRAQTPVTLSCMYSLLGRA